MDITPFAPTASALTHTINIPSRPGQDIFLFMASNAVMTINTQTADWVKHTDSVNQIHAGVWRLPAAKNAGLTSIVIGLSTSYTMAAVVVQDYVSSVGYAAIAQRANVGNQWGTGAHTLNVPKAIGMFAGGSDGAVAGNVSATDTGSLFADSLSSSNSSGHSNIRVILVAVDNYNVVANGITITTDATLTAALVAARSNSGILGYTPGSGGSQVAMSKNDTLFNTTLAAFAPGTLADRERKRLLAQLALTEPQKLTLQDLYRLAGERPRVY